MPVLVKAQRLCLFLIFALVGLLAHSQDAFGQETVGKEAFVQGRETLLLDPNWKFHLGSASDPKADFGFATGSGYSNSGNAHGPAAANFDDSTWRILDLPHDWAIELPFVANGDGDLVGHGSYPIGRAYPNTSVGWYRRRFNIPARDQGKRLTVTFDGIFRDSKVWLNGFYVGRHQSGYTGFTLDITDFVHYGASNVLVVRVDATESEGWFYEGAGIYRHVWLNKTNDLHFTENGLKVSSTVQNGTAFVNLSTTVRNQSGNQTRTFTVSGTIVGPGGQTFQTASANPITLKPNGVATVSLKPIMVVNPHLWSLEEPALYSAHVLLEPNSNKTETDALSTRFGIRTLKFDKDRGFFLNGKHVEIQGTSDHQDHAGVGVAVPDSLQYFRIKRLKAMGSNAIRTTHNAPAPALLDACDELGMLVMDENRTFLSNAETLEDLSYLVKRDRNHPSVIMWSVGNEEGASTTPIGKNIAQTMMRTIHLYDNSRPVSMADNHGNDYANSANEVLDLRGWNYLVSGNPDTYHKEHPNQPVYGSEEASTLSTRGIYANDPEHGYMGAYDTNKPGWGTTAEEWWKYYMARPWLAGAFVWTGFDYRGEPTPYGWPCISSHFGILDTCGFAKDNFYYYLSQWSNKPMVHLLPDWTWPGHEGQPIDVWVYSNCNNVEIYLNGKPMGHLPVPKYGHLEFKVPYASGTLEAKGFTAGGVQIADEVVKTAGVASKLIVSPDRDQVLANNEDVAVFNISAVDANGTPVPGADNLLNFRVEGDAKIIGVGNGDPSSHEPDTYVSEPLLREVSDWTLINKAKDGPWELTLGQGQAVKIDDRTNQIHSGETGLFVGRISLSAEELSALDTLILGYVSGSGTVYVNGALAGHADSDGSLQLSLKGLKVGENVISVYVKAGNHSAGLGRGVNLFGQGTTPTFKRRLFNGLAQVIVKLGHKAGRVTLFAESPGLPAALAGVTASATQPRPTLP